MTASALHKLGEADQSCDYVIISGYHDYRSRRKANLHFIADELVKRGGGVFFLSLRFSQLTRLREDPRHDLVARANQLERRNGVLCYLRRTILHPMRLPSILVLAERASFAAYAATLPKVARTQIAKAKVVLIESGIAITLLPLIRRLNRTASILYMASDSLEAIRQAGTIRRALKTHARLLDGARVPSPYLKSDVPAGIPTFFIPHGVDKAAFDRVGPSPYEPGTINAVSVGSMLFDPSFFEIAAEAFPQVVFHVIGSGRPPSQRPNVISHPEMPFETTLPYLAHAHLAVAAYGTGVEPYLTHTSMKLMQYGYLGLPSVCPDILAATGFGRFGYTPGDAVSIHCAISAALAARRVPERPCLTWAEVTDRLLHPARYEDTRCV